MGRETVSKTWCCPAPSQPASFLGDPGCREAGNAPLPPASGYPFGSDPRPGLSQTLPHPIPPPSIYPPGTSYSTPAYSAEARTRGNLFPSASPATREAHKGVGRIGHKVLWPAPYAQGLQDQGKAGTGGVEGIATSPPKTHTTRDPAQSPSPLQPGSQEVTETSWERQFP